jgi:hypothetical protein
MDAAATRFADASNRIGAEGASAVAGAIAANPLSATFNFGGEHAAGFFFVVARRE